MKGILILLFSLFAFQSHAQDLTDTIHWRPDYKLKWDDFQGEPDSTNLHTAITTATIKYSYTIKDNNIKFSVSSIMDKKQSWTRSKKDLNLLCHEQGHFDINALFSLKLKLELLHYKLNKTTVQKDISKIFRNICDAKNEMDMLYDNETNYSVNQINQKKWEKKIANEINYISNLLKIEK